MVLTAFIKRLPKAELHLHIEGTLEPSMMLSFAKRNGIPLPYGSTSEIRNAYRFQNLQDFLDIYYLGTQVLITEQDFRELTWGYLVRAWKQNILHAEIFFDPQAHTDRGIAFATVVDGIHQALAEAKEALGTSTRLIMCFLRHLSAEAAMATLEEALPFRDRIVAVGLDSSEVGNPPGKFKDVFERARAEGFRCVAHAGEEGPADYVRQALDVLRVERIDHGNRSLDDDALVERLVRERMPLTVCPLSNLKLGIVEDLKDHPLLEMMDRGLLVSINSDDPAYFGGYLNDNYQAMQNALGLNDADLYRLARNSFEASFLSTQEKARFLNELDTEAGFRQAG